MIEWCHCKRVKIITNVREENDLNLFAKQAKNDK